MTDLANGTDWETEKRVTIALLATFSIEAMSLIILAIFGSVLSDRMIVIYREKNT